jgi:hypothetical protein
VVLAVLFGLNTFASNQIAFPLGMLGPDYDAHIPLVEYIYETGHLISRAETYGGFPGQHLISAEVGLVAGLSAETVYLSVGTLAMMLGLLLTYSIGTRIIGDQYALIAMLMYASMSYVIFRGGHPTQQAHILPILFLLFVTTLYLYYRPSTRNMVMFLMFGVLMVMAHHHTAFQAGAMLVALYLGYRLFRPIEWLSPQLFRTQVRKVPSRAMATTGLGARLTVVFSTVYAAHIVFTSGYFPNIVGHIAGFFTATTQEPRDSLSTAARFAEIPTEQFLINTTGEGILFALIVIGVLASLVYLNRTLLMLTTWFVTAGCLAAIGTVIDFPFIIPQRIYVTTQMTAMGFLAAFGLVVLLGRGARSETRSFAPVAVLAVVVFALVFFSASSTIAGIETSPFNTNVGYGPQYEIVEQERAERILESAGINPDSIEWARRFVQLDGTIDYSSAEADILGVNRHQLESGVSPQARSGLGSEATVFPRSPTAGLEEATKIYDNGPVEVYNRQ